MATQESKPQADNTVETDNDRADRFAHFVRPRWTTLETKRRRTRRINELGDALKENPDLLLEPPPAEHWAKSIGEYRIRQAETLSKLKRLELPDNRPQIPDPPPAVNWIPIGPSVAMQGQGATRPAVSGRVVRLAIDPSGSRVYAATANGGVWRSDDAGTTWRSTMDAFDLNPTQLAADSLSCGAIAIDAADPDRVYVGTGEGDATSFFALGAGQGVNLSYFGVGPLRSDDGGANWVVEPVAAGDPALAGQAFWQLAVDPNDREHVVAATTAGLYRRQFNAALNGGSGGYEWAQVQAGNWTDVVVARPGGGPTSFIAVRFGGAVSSSTNGTTWAGMGAGFPTAGVGRSVLAVRPTDPSVVYAAVAGPGLGAVLQGFFRYDSSDNQWRNIVGLVGFAGSMNFDLALAVDPNNVNTVYLGGGAQFISGQWSAEIRHGIITSSGSGAGLTYTVATTAIGAGAHADVHHLIFAPGSSTVLWCGCDGGVFQTTNAGSTATFNQRNVGLQTFTMNHIALHPSEPAVAFVGAQDNGTLRYVGEECWLHSGLGDGGFNVVSWNDPYRVLRTWTGISVRRATDGGAEANTSWTLTAPPNAASAVFYGPLVGCPPSGTAADANIAAAGSTTVWLTSDFGTSWVSLPSGGAAQIVSDGLPTRCTALAFASRNRIFAATTGGQVFRYDRAGGTWSRTRIDTVGGANNLSLAGWITDITIDLADASGASIYVTFGGSGDWRHVWHFNGAQWSVRSGSASGGADALLDVHHNAIVVDPVNTNTLYAGADIGVWRSTNGGAAWSVFSQGLPDAPVIDLKIDPTSRLLRASTHGRSVWEREIDAASKAGVELYMRDTNLDLGRYPTVNGLNDPAAQGTTVAHWRGPNIIVDTPSNAGTYQTPTTNIDFYVFNDDITDGSGGVGTIDPATGTLINRVYVEVHNRGVLPANDVQVMLLLADASAGLPQLPANYETSVQNGTAINTTDWQTVGFVTLQNLRVGFPQVAYFPLPSTMLPPPSDLAGNTHHCLLALLHSPDDNWTTTARAVDPLSIGERKSTHKNLHVVEFTGTVPGDGSGGTTPGAQFVSVKLHGSDRRDVVTDLVLDHGKYPGRVSLLLPPRLKFENRRQAFEEWEKNDTKDVQRWANRTAEYLKESLEKGRFHPEWTKERLRDVARAANQPLWIAGGGESTTLRGVVIPKGEAVTVFVSIGRPRRAQIGDCFELTLTQLPRKSRSMAVGGSTWQVQVVPKPDATEPALKLMSEFRTRRGRRYLEVQVLNARNKPFQTDRGLSVRAMLFGRRGPTETVLDLTFDQRRKVFVLPVKDLPQIRLGQARVTLVVDRNKKQTRKTLDIEM